MTQKETQVEDRNDKPMVEFRRMQTYSYSGGSTGLEVLLPELPTRLKAILRQSPTPRRWASSLTLSDHRFLDRLIHPPVHFCENGQHHMTCSLKQRRFYDTGYPRLFNKVSDVVATDRARGPIGYTAGHDF